MFGRSKKNLHPYRNLRLQSFGWIGLMVLTLIFIGCGSLAELEITADTDRDGKVDFQQDRLGKNIWTPERGALFFNNNDSDMDTHYPDHADDVVNGADDLKDLAAIHIRKIPGLSAEAQISIYVDKDSQSRVRLFYKNRKKAYVSLFPLEGAVINPSHLRQEDLELRIEANSYADEAWSGETVVTLAVTSPDGGSQTDSVLLKVAPFMLLSN